jgi:hypothetical protein
LWRFRNWWCPTWSEILMTFDHKKTTYAVYTISCLLKWKSASERAKNSKRTYNRTRCQFPLWSHCWQGFLFLSRQDDAQGRREHVPIVAKCVPIWFIWSRVQNMETAEDWPKVVASVSLGWF